MEPEGNAMSHFRWATPMPAAGRLEEAAAALETGKAKLMRSDVDCEKVLHVSLFFDGTNNNDDIRNPWRDSLRGQTHSNIARLYNAAIDDPAGQIFKYYIPGVGTPFPDIGEKEYSVWGKAFGGGFAARCLWGYTRVLEAVHFIVKGPGSELFSENDAILLCRHNLTGVLAAKEKELAILHQQRRDAGRRHNVVKQVHVNVFGFSRGAAQARAFLSMLVQEWAPGLMLVGAHGGLPAPYSLNFAGLFDTVASVGLPESTRSAVDLEWFDGHFSYCSGGRLAIPAEVRRCVHHIAVHEQRMSFPLDSAAIGDAYPGNVEEIGYAGMHSDVGGGYAPGSQGKAREGDAAKLSQITLHDMYIEACKEGVKMEDVLAQTDAISLLAEFGMHVDTPRLFNSWLAYTQSTSPATNAIEATQAGMAQMLAWRTLRARYGTDQYLTRQRFYQTAVDNQGGAPGRQAAQHKLDELKETDPAYRALQQERDSLRFAEPDNPVEARATQAELEAVEQALKAREDELIALAAGKGGRTPCATAPGEDVTDLASNDANDLRDAAEQFRLLVAYLHPGLRREYHVSVREDANDQPTRAAYLDEHPHTPLDKHLYVRHESVTAPDATTVALVAKNSYHVVAAAMPYDALRDNVLYPDAAMLDFLTAHTSAHAVQALAAQSDVVRLFDDYVHDSRAGFRMPHFHEYAAGGYGWARAIYRGGDKSLWHFGLQSTQVKHPQLLIHVHDAPCDTAPVRELTRHDAQDIEQARQRALARIDGIVKRAHLAPLSA
jgi:hypothetical protein